MTYPAADISAATQHLAHAALAHEPAGIEVNNFLSAYDHALSRDDHPGEFWWRADPRHPAIARSLKIDPAERGAPYALAPFRLGRVEERPVILAALPCPHFFAPIDIDHLRIETVIAWDPRTDAATILGDDAPQLVGRLLPATEETTIYASPFAFFRAIAEQRAQFAVDRSINTSAWSRKPQETDTTPGLLLLGDPDKVQWPTTTLPPVLRAQGIDPRRLNRAILRSASIPLAIAANQLRSAA